MGRVHADILANRIPEADPVAVADPFGDAADRLAKDFRVPKASTEPAEVIEDPRVQAVIICSSTDTHADLIEQAAGAGKHVFCEKPIALDLMRIDRALAAVARAGVKLQIGFNRRFDPSFARVRELVASGELGEPHLLRITSRDPEPPPHEYVRVSGGMFLDMTIHDFDMARFAIGAEVEEVYTMGAVRIDPFFGSVDDVDTAVICLRFVNGVLGTIDNSRKAVYGYDQRLEVLCSGGMAQADNRTPDSVVRADETGLCGTRPLHFFVERYAESYLVEMRAFVDCLLRDEQPAVTGIDGRIPVVMGYAAKKSLAEGRPVKLSEIDSEERT